MTRRGGWLRLLLLAGLLASPRLAPADGRATASLRADDGLVAPTPRPPAAVRVLPGTPSGGAAPYRGAGHALASLPALAPSAPSVFPYADFVLTAGAAPRGLGSPRFPTGPPGTLPIA